MRYLKMLSFKKIFIYFLTHKINNIEKGYAPH